MKKLVLPALLIMAVAISGCTVPENITINIPDSSSKIEVSTNEDGSVSVTATDADSSSDSSDKSENNTSSDSAKDDDSSANPVETEEMGENTENDEVDDIVFNEHDAGADDMMMGEFLDLDPQFRKLVNSVKAQIISREWTDMTTEHPGLTYFLETVSYENPEYEIEVVTYDATGNGIDELYFTHKDAEGVTSIIEAYELCDGRLVRQFASTENDTFYFLDGNIVFEQCNKEVERYFHIFMGSASGEAFISSMAYWRSSEKLDCASNQPDADFYWYVGNDFDDPDPTFVTSDDYVIPFSPIAVPGTSELLPTA